MYGNSKAIPYHFPKEYFSICFRYLKGYFKRHSVSQNRFKNRLSDYKNDKNVPFYKYLVDYILQGGRCPFVWCQDGPFFLFYCDCCKPSHMKIMNCDHHHDPEYEKRFYRGCICGSCNTTLKKKLERKGHQGLLGEWNLYLLRHKPGNLNQHDFKPLNLSMQLFPLDLEIRNLDQSDFFFPENLNLNK